MAKLAKISRYSIRYFAHHDIVSKFKAVKQLAASWLVSNVEVCIHWSNHKNAHCC